ncbi:MAG: AEC family transporter [Clostridia bacterium]|nr:AEC family transporter [Clostridia bacterium]
MTVIFEQVFILLVFGAVGYGLAKADIIKADHSKMLSGLLVYVFSSCNTFRTFATNFNVQYLKSNYLLILVSVLILAILSLIAHFAAKLFSKQKYTKYVYEYSMLIPNFGYMGYALAESLLGTMGLLSVMVFSIPMSIYIYLIAFCILAKRPFSPKGLLNVMTITMVLGMIAGLLELQMPTVVTSILDTSRACMAPTSMILAGVVISKFKLKEILSNVRIYIITVLRLMVIPVAVGICLSIFFPMSIVQPAVIFLAMPCGLNTVVFPDLVGEDCRIGAGLALVSSLLSCITIPIVLSLFGI